MLVLEHSQLLFKIKRVYFSDGPCEVDDCDAVHFLYCRREAEAQGYDRRARLTAITDLNQDLESIWRQLDRNCRKEIRQAERLAMKPTVNQHYDEFCKINRDLAKRKGFGSAFGFAAPDANAIREHGTLFTVEWGNEVLGGHVYLEDSGHILAWLSASKRLESDTPKANLIGRANRLLHWEAIKYAKQKGIGEFNWGGLWPLEESDRQKQNLNRYKLSFGGKVVTTYSYEKACSKRYAYAQYLSRTLHLTARSP